MKGRLIAGYRFTGIGQIFQNDFETQERGLQGVEIQNISIENSPGLLQKLETLALIVSEIGDCLSKIHA